MKKKDDDEDGFQFDQNIKNANDRRRIETIVQRVHDDNDSSSRYTSTDIQRIDDDLQSYDNNEDDFKNSKVRRVDSFERSQSEEVE